MISRRNFLKAASGTAAILAAPAALAKPGQPSERILQLQNLHTGEKIKATYWAEGQYIAEEIAALNRVLRDHRSNESYKMDQRLFVSIREFVAYFKGRCGNRDRGTNKENLTRQLI